MDPHCPSQNPVLFAFPFAGSASASTRSSRDRPAAASTLLHCARVVALGPWPGPGPGHVASGCFPGLWSSCDAKQVSVLRHPCCAVSGTGLRAPCTHRPAGPAQWAQGTAWQPFRSQEMQRLITTYFTPTGKLLAVLMVQETLCVTTQPWAVIVKLSA